MTPTALAELHALCFSVPRPYTAAEFGDLLASHLVFLCPHASGFALGRAVAGEAELLTLAVHPEHRHAGIGRGLLSDFESEARRRGAVTAFLEVAADNRPAIALYKSAGYAETGRRKDYYRAAAGGHVDAAIMSRALTGD